MKLGEVIEQVRGVSYKPADIVLQKMPGYICLLRANNINNGEVNFDDVVYVKEERVKANQLLRKGDILICASSGSKSLVGKAAVVKNDLLVTFGAFCKVVRPQSRYAAFLGHFFQSSRYRWIISNASAGANINNIRTEDISNIEIQLPNQSVQQIATNRLNLVNDLIQKHKKQIELLDELVKSRFIEMFGDPVFNNMHWDVFVLEDLVQDDCTISYGIVQTGEDLIDGVPVLRPIDIVGGIVPQLDRLKHTSKVISDQYKRTLLKGRELLITVRANIGDTCIVGNEFKGCNVGRGIVPIRVDETKIKLEFLQAQLNELHMHDFIKSKAKGITLIQLNMVDLRKIELIVPPIHIQLQYIDFEKVIKKSKIAIQKSLDKLETLKKSLMQQYFS